MRMSYGLRCGCCNSILRPNEQDLFEELGGWCLRCTTASSDKDIDEIIFDNTSIDDLKRIFKEEGLEYGNRNEELRCLRIKRQ